jgi:hypothetical protein
VSDTVELNTLAVSTLACSTRFTGYTKRRCELQANIAVITLQNCQNCHQGSHVLRGFVTMFPTFGIFFAGENTKVSRKGRKDFQEGAFPEKLPHQPRAYPLCALVPSCEYLLFIARHQINLSYISRKGRKDFQEVSLCGKNTPRKIAAQRWTKFRTQRCKSTRPLKNLSALCVKQLHGVATQAGDGFRQVGGHCKCQINPNKLGK